MNIKKNKTKICRHHRPLLKEEFFKGASINQLSKKYGYKFEAIEKWTKGNAVKKYITSDGVEYRRCNCCLVYRLETDFYWNTKHKKIRTSNCKKCSTQIKRNRYIIDKNIGKKRGYNKLSRDKNKWKYNIRRRVLRIIKYYLPSGKINLKYKIGKRL